VAAYHLSQGNIGRVIDSGIIEKSPRIREMLAIRNIPIDDIIRAKKMLPPEKFNAFVKSHEGLYRDSAVGKFTAGVGAGLKDVPVERFANIGGKMSKSETAGEAVGNLAIGIKEPGIVGFNAIKRLGADSAVSGSVKSNLQGKAVDKLVKPVFSRADKLAEQGKSFGPIEGAVRKYVVNPVTYEAANYKNKATNLTKKMLLG
jgi:hypothetical protein